MLKIKSLEVELQSSISSAKAIFECNLLASLQSNDSYKIFNVTGQNDIPISLHFNGTKVVSDQDKATLFNRYFHSVFTHSTFSLPSICDLPKPHSILSDISITQDDVFQALTSLDPSKASGCDGIGSKLLKNCAVALYQSLHHLF